jgi:hypothetical protein
MHRLAYSGDVATTGLGWKPTADFPEFITGSRNRNRLSRSWLSSMEHRSNERVSTDCECIEQGTQRFCGSAALPDDEKIPGGFGIRKWDHRDTGHGKTLEVGRDQGDGAFASDQSKHVRNTGWFGGYGFSGTMGFFTGTLHIPALFAFLAIAAQFGGALALILGLFTRVAALGIAVNRGFRLPLGSGARKQGTFRRTN